MWFLQLKFGTSSAHKYGSIEYVSTSKMDGNLTGFVKPVHTNMRLTTIYLLIEVGMLFEFC